MCIRDSLKGKGLLHADLAGAEALAAALRDAGFEVVGVEAKPYTRRPYAPFRTSTLQQDAGRKLGFTSDRTMRVAQQLYEGGYITYMRTDSVTPVSYTHLNPCPAAFPATTTGSPWATAVSYTHLDVYQRQLQLGFEGPPVLGQVAAAIRSLSLIHI